MSKKNLDHTCNDPLCDGVRYPEFEGRTMCEEEEYAQRVLMHISIPIPGTTFQKKV